MQEAWDFTRCVSVLTNEIELLRKISLAQESVRQAAMSREWAGFDEKTAEINQLGEEFAILEGERERLFAALAKTSEVSEATALLEEKPFYVLVSRLPLEESRRLSALYRELKTETLKMRALNESFLSYLNEARALAAAYLEAVCPNRGGKLYTRRGRRVSQDLRSIVINNSF